MPRLTTLKRHGLRTLALTTLLATVAAQPSAAPKEKRCDSVDAKNIWCCETDPYTGRMRWSWEWIC